jgi:MarR family transcriptional repressor of emrRAB
VPNPTDRRLENMVAALALAMSDQVADAAATVSGLSDAAPAALVALHESGRGRSIDYLSQMVGLTHSGAVRLVNRLVADGYVIRGEGKDARSIGLALTRRGAGAARRIRAARHESVARSLVTLDDEDRATLTRLCEVLLANVTEGKLRRSDAGDKPSGGALCRLCDFVSCGRPAGDCPTAQAAAAHFRPPPAP